MKKILVSLVVLVAVVLGGGYFLAFTQSGNNILLPFINSYLKQKVDVASVKLDSFTLKPDHINAKANINKMADITLDGAFDISKKSFDMIYTLNAKKIETKDFKFDEKVYIKGKAVGDMKKALIFGVGKVANSDIEYKLDLIEQTPKNITAKIDKASLKKLLILAGQKPYADAIVTLSANIPSIDEKNLKGTAHLTLQKGRVNEHLVKKDFKVELPKATTFSLNSTANLEGDRVKVDSKLSSSLANLTAKTTTFNIKTNTLETPYTLTVPSLSKLYSLTKMKLKGDFKANGKVKLKNKILQVSMITPSLGGKSEVYLVGDKLKAILKKASTNAIFYRLNLPHYTDAKIDADVTLKSIKKLAGDFKVTVNGINKKSLLKKLYNFDSDKDIKYNLVSNGSIKNNKVYATADIKNTFGDVKLKDVVFDMKDASLSSLYTLYLDNLSKLNYITKQKLKGDLKVTGNIKKDKLFMIDGHSNKFGGTIDFKLLGEKITAKVKDAVLTKIQKTLSYPAMLEAKAFADFNYNLSNSKGKATITMKQAKMIPNKLTTILKKLGGTDLAGEHYNDTVLVANLSKSLIDFDFHAISKSVSILVNKGKVYQPSGRLAIKVVVKDKKRNIPLNISGTTSDPKIRLDSSFAKDELKARAKERLEKEKSRLKEKAKEKLKQKLGIDKINKEDIAKDLFKKLF